jgi:VCBS repeat-containing protein
LTLNADGSFSYTPDADFAGVDSFTYHANDGLADSNVATVTITVNGVNDAPLAVDDSGYVTDEEVSLNEAAPGVLGNDSDTEGDPLTAVLDTGPANGTLTLNADGSFSYTPDADFSGVDSFTYHANDGLADSNVATVTITVNAVNDAPVAVDDPGYTTDEDAPLNEAAPGVLGNDTDVEGDPLTAVLDTGPANGTLTLNADGSFSYTPDADFAGVDSFTYHANDGNDSDTEGDPLAAVLDTGPSNGTLTLNADGSFVYTPDGDFSGVDSFTYHANDGSADSNVATVTITVNGVNDAPVAVDDPGYVTDEEVSLNEAAPGVRAGHGTCERDAHAERRRLVPVHAGCGLRRGGHLHLPRQRRSGGFKCGDSDDHRERGE